MYYSTLERAHLGGDYTVMQRSEDRGATWSEVPVPESRGRVQASLVETSPGRLIALFRSRAADRIYLSRSADDGQTWSPPVQTVLPNNNASIQATRLNSGAIALVYNHVQGGIDPGDVVWPRARYPLTAALSDDSGQTWPYRRHVDPGDNLSGEANRHLNRRCAYPSIVQTADGAIHVAYSYRDRQCIKYVRFTEAWIRGERDTLYG
jgi:predicted neuraminidase